MEHFNRMSLKFSRKLLTLYELQLMKSFYGQIEKSSILTKKRAGIPTIYREVLMQIRATNHERGQDWCNSSAKKTYNLCHRCRTVVYNLSRDCTYPDTSHATSQSQILQPSTNLPYPDVSFEYLSLSFQNTKKNGYICIF